MTATHNLAVVVPLVAVAAVCQEKGLEERQGLGPGVAPAAAVSEQKCLSAESTSRSVLG